MTTPRPRTNQPARPRRRPVTSTISHSDRLTYRKARLSLHIEHEQQEWPYSAKAEVALLHEWGLGASPQEAVWVVAYDSMKNVRTAIEVARGMHASVDLHTPTMLAAVLVSGAERFMIAHNHPTGDPTPTQTDLVFTQRVHDAAKATGLYLEDHLILTPRKGRYVSMVDQRLYVPPIYDKAETA